MGGGIFEALDKAVESGGVNLSGKVIAGTGKAAAKLLDELHSLGLLEKSGGRAAKFTLKPEGRAAWEREASAERRQEVRERERQQQRQALADFLLLVQKKHDKPLTPKETAHFPDSLRRDACDRRVVEPGPKPNSYRLLPAGEESLLAEQPIEAQLEQLRKQQQQITTQWNAAQLRLQEELKGLDSIGGQALRTAAAELVRRGQQASQTFDAALAELAPYPGLLAAAQQLRAEFDAACRDAVQRLESEKARLADLEIRLRQTADLQREQLEAIERRVEGRLKDLAGRTDSTKAGHGALDPGQASGSPAPPGPAVWEATRRAHEQLKQETARIGGIVKVPELTDRVRKSFPDLSPAAVHDLLREWQQEDRLTLQLCNDPRLEPRATEGIHSPRGLLFYVQLREPRSSP